MKATLIAFVLLVVITTGSHASIEKDQIRGKADEQAVRAFYEKALTVNNETSPAKVFDEILASGYVSNGSTGSKTKEQLIGQLGFFWKLVPNLKWEIQEIVNTKDRYVVRSIASGNPGGEFMGVAADGSKPFKIMTIDIHTVRNGKIQETYHVEDWSAAIMQLSPEKSEDDISQETMAVAIGFMDAMGKGEMEKMMSLMHEDMVWHNEGDATMPWIGPWKGKKTILEDFMPAFGSNFKTIKWEPNDALSSGDTAAFFGKMIGLLTGTDKQTSEFTYALRVKVKDGKVILWNWFEDSYEVSKAFHGN